MKRGILLIALLFAAVFSGFSQIEAEIQQSKSEKISKGRAYLLEKFLDRDYSKVKEIKDYLMGLEDDYYVALRPVELWHILQWTGEYDELTSLLRRSDSAYFNAFRSPTYYAEHSGNKVLPNYDNLGQQIYIVGLTDKHLLQFGLQEAELSAEDRAFLTMFLDWLFVEDHYFVKDVIKDADQAKLNEMATQFLSDYPNTDYEWFVRHLIRKNYAEEGIGWGMGFGACSALATGVLQRPIIGICMDFDLFYKKLDLCFSFSALYSQTRADQEYGDGNVYLQGKECDYLSLDAYLAYPVFEGKSVKISPFLGGGWMEEYYAWAKDAQLKDLIKKFGVGHAGLFLDCDLANGSYVRFKYDFGLTGFKHHQLSQMHRVSVSWNVALRKQKRVY